ncbi:MAG: hypothetical protein WA102_13800 [Candidatus Methanoperedens sp.]
MDFQTIFSTLGLLGVGGAIGSYIQHLLNQKRETELRIQTLNETKYRSTLVFMRCFLKPENRNHFHTDDPHMQELKNDKEVKEYANKKLIEFYYISLLYASDDVIIKMKEFMENPTEANFMKTAISMRNDLWKKGTKINPQILSLE